MTALLLLSALTLAWWLDLIAMMLTGWPWFSAIAFVLVRLQSGRTPLFWADVALETLIDMSRDVGPTFAVRAAGAGKQENRGVMATPYKANLPCHICGLPIPFVIVDPTHPLVGTIDHIIPKSRGGTDRANNRAPAHRCCNLHKKSDDLTDEIRERLRRAVLRIFSTANDEIFAALVKHQKAKMRQLPGGQRHAESIGPVGLMIAGRKLRASFSPNRLRAQNLRMLAGRDADENGLADQVIA